MTAVRIDPYAADGRLALVTPYSAQVVTACKTIPGMRWASDRKAWVGYPDAIACVLELLRGKVRWEIPDPPPRVMADRKTLGVPIPTSLDRAYQRAGVVWLRATHAGILADDMGLGKSAQVLTAARLAGGRCCVVCPAYVKGVWAGPEGQIAKWWPGAFAMVAEGTTPADNELPGPETDVLVVNYDILHAWVGPILAWGGVASDNGLTIIFDEAQALTGANSRRTRSARVLRGGAARVWALTGTPMPNFIRDLHPLLETLCPGRFGSFFQFAVRYCDGHKVEVPAIQKTVWDFGGRSNEEELSRRLSYLMLRRTKDDVALELPAKLRTVEWLDPPSGVARLVGRTLDETMTQLGDAKVQAAVETSVRLVQGGARVIVGCWRQAIAEWIVEGVRACGIAAEVIVGGLAAGARGKRLARIRDGGGVLVVTIDSCATGIDLTWASCGVIAELLYDPRKLLQFESRLHRHGAKAPVSLTYLAMRRSIDETIMSRVVSKLDAWEKVIGAGASSERLATEFGGGALSEADILRELTAGLGA